MKIHKTQEILKDLNDCIINKKPFSLLRYGDGGLKFIHSVLYNDRDQLFDILKKEGIPLNYIVEVFELWGYYTRRANYIDTPEVYFTSKFWPRLKSSHKPMNKKTREKLIKWKELYYNAEFDNVNFCNPEINFLSILNKRNYQTILDIIKDRKVCCITTFPEVKERLLEFGYNIDTIKIVGHYENHYKNSFEEVVNKIKETANDYDLFLVAAGELGRIYSGIIKEEGGRTFDIGFVVEYWLHSEIPIRLQPFLQVCNSNPLMLELTRRAFKYNSFL